MGVASFFKLIHQKKVGLPRVVMFKNRVRAAAVGGHAVWGTNVFFFANSSEKRCEPLRGASLGRGAVRVGLAARGDMRIF